MFHRLSAILLVLLSVALIAAVVVWVLRDEDSTTGTAEPQVGTAEPRVVSAAELADFAGERSAPVYWLGGRDGETYELTGSPSDRVYVRYLPAGADAGDERVDSVTVATYPAEDAVSALRRAARGEKGAKLGKTDDGAVLLVDPTAPNNAHLAYPGADLQVEVYSPVPGEALRLAARGEVRPVR